VSEDKIKSIIGEIPNYIFEYLELSDDIKKEWKYGSTASDFGGHEQFVQKFSARLSSLAPPKPIKGDLRNSILNILNTTQPEYTPLFTPSEKHLHELASLTVERLADDLLELITQSQLDMLDRLEANKEDLFWWTGGEYTKTTGIDMRALQSERDKLKATNDDN